MAPEARLNYDMPIDDGMQSGRSFFTFLTDIGNMSAMGKT